MKTPRTSFGACFTRAKTHLVVSGGLSTGFKPTKKTEVYNLNANAWSEAGQLAVARRAHSMCEVGGGAFIYVFGGQGEENDVLDTIERAPISNGLSSLESAMGDWTLLGDIKLQQALCDIGCFPISRNEVLLFGGLNSNMKEVKKGIVLMCLSD